MKSLLTILHNWRYRRLLRKLFWLYAQKTDSPVEAIQKATYAFQWFTREKIDRDIVNYWWYL